MSPSEIFNIFGFFNERSKLRRKYKNGLKKKSESCKKREVERVESCSGVLNIKPISGLMKCKYYGESLSWNTERMGAKGGSDSLFQVFTFRLWRLWETSAWRQTEKVNAQVQERDGSPEFPQSEKRRSFGDQSPK